VLTYYNLLQKYKKAVKDTENEGLPEKTEYFQKRVDEWTKKLQDLPDSERIMREYNISVLDGLSRS